MELPALTLPKIDLPFDVPVLLHPPVDHFAIALPVVVLLLEFYNLFTKRKSIGAFSFVLLIVTVVVFALAYLTGSVDGKEAYDLLAPEGQEALKSHKLLGTYLLIATVVVLFFKLLSMTGKGFLKVLFFMGLIGLIAVTFEQGEHGGELVYKYGANVERVKTLDDELFDLKEELEDLNTSKATSAQTVSRVKIKEKKEVAPEVVAPVMTPEERDRTDKLLESAAKEMKEASQKVLSSVKETATQEMNNVVSEAIPAN